MGDLILFPTHPKYCEECIHNGKHGNCLSELYLKNQALVNKKGYCQYKEINNKAVGGNI